MNKLMIFFVLILIVMTGYWLYITPEFANLLKEFGVDEKESMLLKVRPYYQWIMLPTSCNLFLSYYLYQHKPSKLWISVILISIQVIVMLYWLYADVFMCSCVSD